MPYMSQLCEGSTYQHAAYYFINTHNIKMHNITKNKQKMQNLQVESTFHCKSL